MKKIIVLLTILLVGFVIGYSIFQAQPQAYCVSQVESGNQIQIHSGSNEVVVNVHFYNHTTGEWSTQPSPLSVKGDEVLGFQQGENELNLYRNSDSSQIISHFALEEGNRFSGCAWDGSKHSLDDGKEWIVYIAYCGENGFVSASDLQQSMTEDMTASYTDDVYVFTLVLQ